MKASAVADKLLGLGNLAAYAVIAVIGIVVVVMLCQWGYTEWWDSQHCTMIMGTRVCR